MKTKSKGIKKQLVKKKPESKVKFHDRSRKDNSSFHAETIFRWPASGNHDYDGNPQTQVDPISFDSANLLAYLF